MSKHSPGPWRWEDWHGVNNTMRLMCSDGDSVIRIHNDGHGREPAAADAALIAAAPDLADYLRCWLIASGCSPPVQQKLREGTIALLARIEGDK